MKWIHITEAMPDCGRVIIKLHPPADVYDNTADTKCWTIVMDDWSIASRECFLRALEWYKEDDIIPQWWWMYAEDFPFPAQFRSFEPVTPVDSETVSE